MHTGSDKYGDMDLEDVMEDEEDTVEYQLPSDEGEELNLDPARSYMEEEGWWEVLEKQVDDELDRQTEEEERLRAMSEVEEEVVQ